MQIEAGWLLASITGIVSVLAGLIGKLLLEYKSIRDSHDVFLVDTIEWQREAIDVLTNSAKEALKSGHEAVGVALTRTGRRP